MAGEEQAQATKSSATREPRRRKRTRVIAKRMTVGLTEVQLEALKRERESLQAAAPKGRTVTESEALRALVEGALARHPVGVSGGPDQGVQRESSTPARGVGAGPGRVPLVPLTESVHQAVVGFGEAVADLDASLRHPLGTNVNQVAKRLNAGGRGSELAVLNQIRADLALIKERQLKLVRAVNLGVMRWGEADLDDGSSEDASTP